MLDSYLLAIILIILSVLVSVLGLLLTRLKMSRDTLKQCHDVGGYLLSVVGTMYAVLLGLVVVDSMTRFDEARRIVEQEANSLADVFILSERFPREKCKAVQELCLKYVSEVVESEWDLMDGSKVSLQARKHVFEILREVMDFEPVTESQKAIYPLAVQKSCDLWDNRRARTNISSYGLPAEEWAVLVVGGLVCTAFTYFFSLDNIKIQITMTAMVAITIALNLFLVLMFAYPFSGDMKVHPDSLKVDELIFRHRLGLSPASQIK